MRYLRLLFLSGWVLLATSLLAQKNAVFLDSLQYSKNVSDIWGYADSTSGNEYALVGVKNGLSIVDVSDSTNINFLHFIKGPSSIWRDIKTWKHYAYVVNETDSGMLIVDLSGLPGSISTQRCGDFTAHNLFIDENGKAFIFGTNQSSNTLIADLASDPMSPPLSGQYVENYVHDGYVRGDTLWSSEIYQGKFGVVDVSNPDSPIVIARQSTPYNFTHNTWLADDQPVLFTTDETNNAYVAAYDVSDLSNIQLLDRYRTKRGSGVIPHNTFYHDSFLVTSYYTDGFTIVDATRPSNLVEVGHYDTSPFSGGDFKGCWGVYPYLPNGLILASDIEQGLYVIDPNYERACYLEGTVLAADTLKPVDSVKITLKDTSTGNVELVDYTNAQGEYTTGTPDSGVYNVCFSGSGCQRDTVFAVQLDNGTVTNVNDTLDSCQLILPPQDQQDETRSASSGVSTLHGRGYSLTSATSGGAPKSLCEVTAVQEIAPDGASIRAKALPTLFDRSTLIEYRLPPSNQKATMAVFNLQGQRVYSTSLEASEGSHKLGTTLPAGMYWVRLTSSRQQTVFKIIKTNSR